MNRSDERVGILVPEGRDRELIRDMLSAEGWDPTFPTEGPDPQGPWRDVDLLIVDQAWLEEVRLALERTKRDAGSEFVPTLLVAPEEAAPPNLPPLCDQLLTYPTTRATFVAAVAALMRARIQSRRVYRSFFENALIGVYRATMDGHLLMTNDALARILGFSGAREMKEADGRIPGLRPTGGESLLLARLGESGRAEAVPERWESVDGREIHVLHSARVVGPEGESDVRPVVEGTVEDVTELVESRERLVASERFLQSAIDALSAHVAILSPTGRILGVNEAWRTYGSETRPPGATDKGVDYLEVCARADEPTARRVASGIREVIRGDRRVFQTEYPCHSPTEYSWFRVVVTAFPEEPPRRTVVAHENITELKKAQRRFQLLIEGSSELTLVVGDTGVVRYRSPSAAEFLGVPELEGLDLRPFMHPSDRGTLAELTEAAESDGMAEFRLRHVDGSWRDMEWTVTDMRDSPLVHGFVLHGRDITERKSMMAELRHQEREIREMQKMEAVGRLAGGVAHDFNNLLTTIRGNVNLVGELLSQDGATLPAEVEESLSEMRRATEQGSFLTRRLLVFSHKEPEAEPTVEDLNEILRGLGRMLQRLVSETIDFRLDLSEDVLPVLIRPGEIEQVVVNLTVNAAYAMRRGGSLLIRTGRIRADRQEAAPRGLPSQLDDGIYATLEVADTGEGIPPEIQEKVFEPFFTTKARGEGTGLGLATVYGILDRAGGGIAVYSEVGVGTRFTAYLPISAESLRSSSTVSRPEPAEVEGGETLLLVEDEGSVRTVARRGLERLGYTVLEAENGVKALEVLASPQGRDVSVIVTDFVMPEMSGLELAQTAHSLYPAIPVLLTSGYPDSELDLPADLSWDMLSKPYDLVELGARVRQMIEGAR